MRERAPVRQRKATPAQLYWKCILPPCRCRPCILYSMYTRYWCWYTTTWAHCVEVQPRRAAYRARDQPLRSGRLLASSCLDHAGTDATRTGAHPYHIILLPTRTNTCMHTYTACCRPGSSWAPLSPLTPLSSPLLAVTYSQTRDPACHAPSWQGAGKVCAGAQALSGGGASLSRLASGSSFSLLGCLFGFWHAARVLTLAGFRPVV